MKVNYNVSAMIANNALQRNDNLLSESLERLSSGLKIANAKDNPSGLAMSRRMNSQIEGLGVAGDSSNDAISIVQVADGSLSEIHEILQRMNQLAVQASNGTLTDSDRQTIQEEVSLLKQEIERMAQTTQFNGQNILDGTFDLKGYTTVGDSIDGAVTDASVKLSSYSDVVEAGQYKITGIDVSYINLTGSTGVDKKGIFFENGSDKEIKIYKVNNGVETEYMTNGMSATINEDVLTLKDSTGKRIDIQIDRPFDDTVFLDLTASGAMTMQVGANEGQTLDIRIPKVSLTTLGIYNLDMANTVGAREAIEDIKGALSTISSIRARLGSYQNRLEHTSNSLDITVENMTAAYSRIMDVDMAEEMTVYSTQQVLSQAGTSMMAQANERPSQVLQLLQ
ncbi:flagellin N-terminal helical domain-containing protein [Butyrivibrio sp. INlla14]|uniref:flagellin N-terminal helical domain-containing protein n=1 Tax=Butyrivibrio sp. INlla14 TaxID=1520808 RepID=UPI000876583E|nr:flagellin [Butyrivibrio sp. INlla14]SCX92535.1 flagellin [Butyrivibrio sp. INlla14]